MRRAAAGILIAGLVVAAGALTIRAAVAAGVHTVLIENMQFSPSMLVVRRGDRVVWINKDLFPHTVTANGNAFDSHTIQSNASWTYRAQRAGKFNYRCSLHPTMQGMLSVIQ